LAIWMNPHRAGPVYSIDIDFRALQMTMSYHKEIGLPDGIHNDWIFLSGDSLCMSYGWKADINMLFIDSDHGREHTLKELLSWSPMVRGKIFLHDTELKSNGCQVKAAIMDFLGMCPGWQAEFLTEGCGMGILQRKPLENQGTKSVHS
jgi:hypothetical protein